MFYLENTFCSEGSCTVCEDGKNPFPFQVFVSGLTGGDPREGDRRDFHFLAHFRHFV